MNEEVYLREILRRLRELWRIRKNSGEGPVKIDPHFLQLEYLANEIDWLEGYIRKVENDNQHQVSSGMVSTERKL